MVSPDTTNENSTDTSDDDAGHASRLGLNVTDRSDQAANRPAGGSFHLKSWLLSRGSGFAHHNSPLLEQRPLALGSLDQPRPEDFGVLAYAYVSSVSTATALRSLTAHPFFRELGVQVVAEPVVGASEPRANGQTSERVRVSMPVPTARYDVPPRQLIEEVFASIVGLGRWRVEVRRDERFFTGELVLPVVRGEPLTAEQGQRLAGGLADGSYAQGPQASLLCGWEPVDLALPEGAPLRTHLSGSRLSQLLGDRSRALYERARANSQLADRLLVVMAEACGLIYKAAVAAKTLKTSERTMRRRLAAEGTSFQQVLDEFRAALAQDYLAVTSLPTQLIGELLGFTEATNFRRAFIRWADQSPHQFRRAAQEQPAS